MLYHLQSRLPESFRAVGRFGWMGVDLFFVLSGYLIGSQLLRAHQASSGAGVWAFYRRRLYRILPAYLVVLAIYFVWPSFREQDGISPLWQFLTFTENLLVDYSRNAAFSHVWSLCIEEQFYLLFPLILLTMLRRPSLKRTVALLAGLVALGIVCRTWFFFHELVPLGPDEAGTKYIERIYYPTYSHMDGLLAGVTIALVRIFRPAWWRRLAALGHASAIIGLALVALAMRLFVDRFSSQTGAAAWGTFIGYPLLTTGLALIVASAISNNGLLSRIRVPGAQWLATLAYSLYLSHKAVAHLTHDWLPSLAGQRDLKALATYAVTCAAAAAVLHFAVERPFMLLRDRHDQIIAARNIEEAMRLDPAL